MLKWALLLCAVAAEVTASLSLKAALERPVFYVLVSIGYVGAFVLMTAILRQGLPLGVVYGIWAALGVAATAVLSALIFDEPLTAVMIGGLLLIIAGVLIVEVGSQRAKTQLRSQTQLQKTH
ncbi:DMT family transporter [Rhodococcus wratislaviensis]|uniref:DMT family transporter n=1 Tax=Rhodococcus wratislaviensis TaxID=44752 RepID=UPI0036555DB1